MNADKATQAEETIEQHSLPVSITLHLLPGLLVLGFYVMIAPFFTGWGFPASFAVLLGFVFVGIPFQLGFLYYQGFKINDKLSLKGVLHYREKIPLWQFVLIVLVLFAYAVAVAILTTPLGAYLKATVLSFLPAWFLYSSAAEIAGTELLIVLGVRVLVNGIANPIVEEMYFRGYLLPRISRLHVWAPLINAMLFSIAHYWQPANIPQLFLIMIPWCYVVWWKRNIYISIAVHCMANLFGAILAFVSA